ncbi:MAG: response regulator transcription factor [Bacteroidales bacterium]|nr:response regulator transcription factor [Bacteroidales bacterium]HPD95969.1 LytTR family DNA-binding domain-containing protein [Tenuifilaceae bacterium]
MNYIIVEDEKPSAERLKLLISSLRSDYNHIATFDSVSSTVKWLKQNPHPELAFFDIQLADGISFEIFEQVKIDFPVIFTTAYNEYALKAFKVNSIDYLLKPVNETELKAAIEKFHSTRNVINTIDPNQIANLLSQLNNNYKTRFVVKVGEHLKMIDCSNIAFFHSMNKSTFIRNIEGRDYAIDQTLDQIELAINPTEFYRVNRSCIMGIKTIRDIVAYSNSRLKIVPTVKTEEDIIVSRERVSGFKEWLEK